MSQNTKKRYETSHPWLTFNIRLDNAGARLWMALGEAQSKCEHIAGIPLPPEVAAKLNHIYLAKGAWATTAIEGNSLSEAEVRRIVAGEHNLPSSKEYLQQEIQNIIDACRDILKTIHGDIALLRVEDIKRYNRLVLKDLNVDPHVTPGEFCTHSIGVADYLAPPREDTPYLMSRMCEWINDPSFRPTGSDAIVSGTLRAVIAHLYIAWIHPFGDGNGRTARMVEYQILLAAGVPTPAAHLMSNHYNQTRSEYYRQMSIASKTDDPVPFIQYAVNGFVDGLREQIEVIQQMQRQMMWTSYIHAQFGGKGGKTELRRRDLLLDLSDESAPVALSDIAEMSARMARHYAQLSIQTVRRDMEDLVDLGFVAKTETGYTANMEQLKAFLPVRHEI